MTTLERLKRLDRPIRVGIIGAGAMGKGLVYQCSITPGIRAVALADIQWSKAIEVAKSLRLPYDSNESPSGMEKTIGRQELSICSDGNLVATCPAVDVLIEATSSILEGAEFVLAALRSGKPVVLMNAEIDLAFRPYFDEVAEENETVCSSIDGDQYGVIKRLIDDLEMWGFELVLAGNIKGFLRRSANPTNIRPEADKRNLDYKMCTAYTDGTKLSIEMALLANAYGLRVDVPGMHGPRAVKVQEALRLFDLDALREGGAVVDYILGAEPGGGVFAIGYHEHFYQQQMMNYYKMGEGPYYLFYRPYHLCHVEALESVALAFLDYRALLPPKHGYRAEVYAYAKYDLARGHYLDGLGGHTCYGAIDNTGGYWPAEGVPICLSEGLRLKRSIRMAQPIMLPDVEWKESSPVFRLYARAREAGGGGTAK